MVLDAVERLGLEPTSAPATASASTPLSSPPAPCRFDEGVRLVAERAEAMHDAGIENPGTMAAVLGLDDDEVEVACRRADDDVWVANFNAPGQVVIAGSETGVAPGRRASPRSSAPRRSCRCRCRARSTRRSWRRRATGCARPSPRRRRATPRCRSSPTSTPSPTTRAPSGRACCRPSCAARCGGSTACSPWPTPASPTFVELGPGGVLTGMAKRTVDGARAISVAVPEDLDKLLELVSAGGRRRRQR